MLKSKPQILRSSKCGQRFLTIVPIFHTMASDGALSGHELKQFNELLQRAQTHGVKVSPIMTPEDFDLKSSGKFGSPTVKELLEKPSSSMTDASKRQRSDSDWEQVDYTPAVLPETSRPENFMTPSKQMPLVPVAVNKEQVTLPPGISSLQEWGNVLNELPKFAHLKASFKEMTEFKDPEIADYLVWVIQHGKSRGGRFQDFCEYLMAVKYKPPVKAEQICSPGSKMVRTFKK